jgi:hypothetical protein
MSPSSQNTSVRHTRAHSSWIGAAIERASPSARSARSSRSKGQSGPASARCRAGSTAATRSRLPERSASSMARWLSGSASSKRPDSHNATARWASSRARTSSSSPSAPARTPSHARSTLAFTSGSPMSWTMSGAPARRLSLSERRASSAAWTKASMACRTLPHRYSAVASSSSSSHRPLTSSPPVTACPRASRYRRAASSYPSCLFASPAAILAYRIARGPSPACCQCDASLDIVVAPSTGVSSHSRSSVWAMRR